MNALRRVPPLRLFALILSLTLGAAAIAHAQPTPGFREDWPILDDVEGWGGGANPINPGSGGYHGAGDGFLKISLFPLEGFLGANSIGNNAYVGNWLTSGVTQVRVWMNDIGAADPLEMHFGIGLGTTNFWQYNIGFVPPHNAWGEYVIDLNAADFTRTHGTSGTFNAALSGATRILFRHDLAPFIGNPDPIAADVGIDHLLLTDGVLGVEPLPPSVGRPVELAPPAPNPSRGPVAFSWVDPSGGAVTLQVVDAQGRSVRSERLTAGGAGPRTWLWDGADDRGARVAPGYYRVRAVGVNGGTSRPLVRVR